MPKDIVNHAKQYVTEVLETLKDRWFLYHNLKHTIEVLNRSTYLAEKEGVSVEDLEIIQLGALFHDLGFVKRYEQNESIGAEIAQNFLMENDYPEYKTKKVVEIILSTSPLIEPKCKLWAILKDADLDNMWREDFLSKNMLLRYECKFIKGLKINEKIRLEKTLDFLKEINMYTNTQKKERAWNFEENKNTLAKLIWQRTKAI